jgi:hypothetical protein
VLEGQLLDQNGKPTAGTVAAVAWPNQAVVASIGVGAEVPTLAVAAAPVGRDGRFVLQLDPKVLPADYLAGDGQVDLELIAWNGKSQRHWFTSARTDAIGDQQVWVHPTADANPSANQGAEKTPQGSITLSDAMQAQQSQPEPQVAPCYPPILVSTHNVWVMIGRSMNYNVTQDSWMSAGSSQSITLGVAVSSQSAAGYSASGTTSTTTGVTFTWQTTTDDRNYYVETQYGKYRQTCFGVTQYTFRPRTPTGGFKQQLISYNPNWTRCAGVSAGVWSRTVTQGNTTSFSAGVSAVGHIGINLSFESSYSTNRTLNYHQTVARHLCGNNNSPSLAGEIEGAA